MSERRKTASNPERRFRAQVKADLVHKLEPLIRAGQRFDWHGGTGTSVGGLVLEPCAAGGVLLVAAHRFAVAAVRDASGFASRPIRLTVPDHVFERVAPPRGVSGWAEGETFELELPAWAQPHAVYFHELSAMVVPKMHHPAYDPAFGHLLGHAWAEDDNVVRGDYRVHDEVGFDWRKVFLAPRTETPAAPVQVNLALLAMFDRLTRGHVTRIVPGGPRDALFIVCEGFEFAGALMPTGNDGPPWELPPWTRRPPDGFNAAHVAAAAKRAAGKPDDAPDLTVVGGRGDR